MVTGPGAIGKFVDVVTNIGVGRRKDYGPDSFRRCQRLPKMQSNGSIKAVSERIELVVGKGLCH